MKSSISIAIHGGAGSFTPNTYSKEELAEYEKSLEKILSRGVDLLKAGQPSIETVVQVCTLLEDDPLFNAGRGSVFNGEGEIEMDASVMDGHTLKGGGVTGLKKIKNPILAARIVMEKSPHTLLSGLNGEEFCRSFGLETCEADYFKTEKRYQQFLKAKDSGKIQLDHGGGSTVGAVAKDRFGRLAAATSTGGMTGKFPGRVSDSSIIGAGTFANGNCAISGTGTGDQFILGSIAKLVSTNIETMPLEKACDHALEHLLQLGGVGGLIALDSEGNAYCPFNSTGMFRGLYIGKIDKVSVCT